MESKPKHVYHTIIQTTQEKLWDALVNPEITRNYFFNFTVDSDWQVGSEIQYTNESGEVMLQGEILECNASHRLVYSFRGFEIEPGVREPYSKVTFELEEISENATKLTVVHDEFPEKNKTFENVGNGWPTILSGLKTFLETGKPLNL